MTAPEAPRLICLTGPTAAGKTAAALALAARWPIEIVTMDSATIYHGMDIGTAKPSASERARVAHHLLDIRDPAQAYSAAEFAQDAAAHIQAIRARGHLPVLCGGTLLYYRALRQGLNDLPPAQPALRRSIARRADTAGWPALHAELARHDPASAARIAPHDRQRLQRALEVWYASGRSLSSWLAQPPRPLLPGWHHDIISLEPAERRLLNPRIARRFHAMMAAGLLEEVEALHARSDLNPDLPALRSVGYRQLWRHLDGHCSQEAAIEQAIAASRQLAKRQMTWLRSLSERNVLDCLADAVPDRVIDAFARALSPATRAQTINTPAAPAGRGTISPSEKTVSP